MTSNNLASDLQLSDATADGQRVSLRIAFVHEDGDELEDVVFKLRDFEQGVRRAFLAISEYSDLSDVPVGGPLLSDHPTRPEGYRFTLKRMTKSSPIQITVTVQDLHPVLVLLAIWISTTAPTPDDIRDVARAIFDIPAQAIEGLRSLLAALAGLIRDIRGFRELIDDAFLDVGDAIDDEPDVGKHDV